ncbi:MAG: AMP-binding protein [Candidatus Onthomonas sp.]|nr:AMP-binding protein [Candidatus Onthomonas sp.]
MEFTYDATMFRQCFEHDFTWINGFSRNVRRFPNKSALTDPAREKSWTYRQLNGEANRLAHRWQADGVKKNDVVMYMLYNSPEFVFCYVATQKIDAIGCPINYNFAPGEIAIVLEDSKPKVFLYDAEFEDRVAHALELSSWKPASCIAVGGENYERYVQGQSEEEPVAPERHIYDEVLRLYTSGTTGRPRGVPINHINEVLTAHDVMMHFPLNSTDRTMNMTPWFHRGGIHSGGPNPTLYAGGEVIVLRVFQPKLCLKYTQQYHITFLIGVPSVLAMLAKSQERDPVDLSSLKGIVTMGSPLDKKACIHFQSILTPNIFNGYGTTESFWNSFLRPYDLPDMAGSAGRACTDDEVLVVKALEDRKAEPWEVVAQDNEEVGEIIIKSPAKSAYCYYNNPSETEKRFYKGFLYTGDLGTWDENQYIHVVGRKDDMIISAGENIYPVQIEEVLQQNPRVSDCIVTSVPDKTRGEAVVAYLIPADDTLTVQDMLAYCAGHPMLSTYKCPKYYRFVKELPYNATGKKLHYRMKEQALQDKEAGLLERF